METEESIAADTNAVASTNGISEHVEHDKEEYERVEDATKDHPDEVIDYQGEVVEGDDTVNTEVVEEEEEYGGMEMGVAEYLEGEMPEEEDESHVKEDENAQIPEKGDQEAEPEEASFVESEEGELITGDGDDPQPKTVIHTTENNDASVSARASVQQKDEVDENQCRVCTGKKELVSLFKKVANATPADMLMTICPSVSIALKDYMPQFICNGCLDSVTIAINLKNKLETTERDLRKHLSRSKNKVRRPRGYVVIDAPVSDSGSEEEELNDDVEFKVSDVGGSTTAESDSADSDISDKRKRTSGRGRRKRKQGRKRAVSGSGNNNDDDGIGHKKKCIAPAAASQGPFECDRCDLTFSRKQSYVLHRKTHDPSREIQCEICNKIFKVQRAFQTHMERHELERLQFNCELCPEAFKLRAELKRHMSMKHDEDGLIYECKRCHRTFLTQTRLQRHQSLNCPRLPDVKSTKRSTVSGENLTQGRDLFKSVAPPTTTYWSDSFSE
ncbi:zinc finger protein 37 [Scaptodrosophila lebanonensis]|uniref:Zinc finger protein 37 n=1 Tax=Drosophila lebanonensis TaxID=7225 RepID=A0A6J2TI63_DROLE|nr:zinc finger protein 37 [Scaptodrosophila lebanonensis]